MRQGDSYQVVSRLSVADATSLREASTAYPAWVEQTYLQVPDGMTPETLALAEELTAPYDNPYDMATAVQNYLRENITYNDQIEAPPDDVDPIHYTLFVSREGYCNYYAYAMAMMLRSQGVPARLVSGYAQGTYIEDAHTYRVKASNSHTWVEVYFPSYGWVQFEPTAAIPVITRPERAVGEGGDPFGSFAFNDARNSANIPEEDLLEPEDPQDLIAGENRGATAQTLAQSFPLWQALGAAFVVLAAIGLSWTANNMNRRVEMDVDRSYKRLSSWARWVGVQHRPEHTPYERADSLATAVPEGKEDIRMLTRQYVLKQFSRQRMYEDGFDPLPHWQSLRPLFVKKSLSLRAHKWQQKSKRGRKFRH
jgi:transglutaminase-like putative cysteine protease